MKKPGDAKATEDVSKEVYAFVKKHADKESKKKQLGPEVRFSELGFSSIKLFQMLAFIEKQTGVEIDQLVASVDLASIRKIADLQKVISKFRKK